MIALFFLGILFLCHSHATLSESSKGDYPDANEVMWMLPETYMLQSGRSYPTLLCGYQVFFNSTSRGQTYKKYDLYFFYKNGKFINQPLYVKNVTGYTVYMGTRPEAELAPTRELQILFSDMESCMIAKNPNPAFPNACSLMVKKDKFSAPPEICARKFTQHCKSQGFKYTIQNCPK
uniref:Putative secreted protein n=2 Tax=Ixodes ricinus TaxID=34613 RepID=A0A090X9I1_IXORI